MKFAVDKYFTNFFNHTFYVKILLAPVVLGGLTINAFGQSSESAIATATIVAPISIEQVADMNFGNVAVTDVAGTVILATAGTRTTSGCVTLPADAGTVTAAEFTVTGEVDYTYDVTVPTSHTITRSAGTETMTVDAFASDPTAAAGVLTLGTHVFEDGKKTEIINLTNVGSDTVKYGISFIQFRMNENGNFERITEPDQEQFFADTFLHYYPRTVTLAPHESQIVKIQLTITSSLQPGEYRYHLYFRAELKNNPLGEDLGSVDSSHVHTCIPPVLINRKANCRSSQYELSSSKHEVSSWDQPNHLSKNIFHRMVTSSRDLACINQKPNYNELQIINS